MNKPNVLIVEDELLIATDIQAFLNNNNFNVIGIAISYDEAVEILSNHKVDFVLLDINLSGKKTGIDLAEHINLNFKIPFIYLTSYSDKDSINKLKDTNPVGYHPKPLHHVGLLTALELYFENNNDNSTITIESGAKTYNFLVSDIKYVQASHIYTIVHTIDEEHMIRITLKKFLENIPKNSSLVRVNRSTALNAKFVSLKRKNSVSIGDQVFQISKAYAPSF